ncbi:MAG TPA: c-type cytochrome [Vicinamibacterales bacterium]|nr:c-type cytochrome [Vicinamibacterales bacterium]
MLPVVALAAAAAAAAQAPRGDPAAVDRGRPLFVAQCGFCHGSNARGGSNGPDLTRSIVVQEDEDGKQLGEFVRAGRPDRGMPKFDLPDAQISDVAAFLHGEIRAAADRNAYKILDILVGDPNAGEAFFAGAGGCTRCHRTDGDLKGIGAKYEPSTLQARMLVPRGNAGRGGPPLPAYRQKNAVKAVITLPNGETVSGAVVRITDFEATIYDSTAEIMRSVLRNGDQPRVVVIDPLQAHMDMLLKWSDADMHNVTAYLAGLK